MLVRNAYRPVRNAYNKTYAREKCLHVEFLPDMPIINAYNARYAREKCYYVEFMLDTSVYKICPICQ